MRKERGMRKEGGKEGRYVEEKGEVGRREGEMGTRAGEGGEVGRRGRREENKLPVSDIF